MRRSSYGRLDMDAGRGVSFAGRFPRGEMRVLIATMQKTHTHRTLVSPAPSARRRAVGMAGREASAQDGDDRRRRAAGTIVARRARAAAQDPEVQRHLKVGSEALGKAAKRLRDSEPGDAVADEKLRSELRRAALAMASGYQAAAHPKKRRRRLGRTVLAVGMIGAGAYAGYRVVRERQNGAESVATDDDHKRDETLAASFPASDPPPGPTA